MQGIEPWSEMRITHISTPSIIFKHNSGFLSIIDKLNIMAGNKNNPSVRQFERKKLYQGKEMKPCLYDGRAVGRGKYMAGTVDGDMILDTNGKPMPYRAIPVDFA